MYDVARSSVDPDLHHLAPSCTNILSWLHVVLKVHDDDDDDDDDDNDIVQDTI